MAKAGLLARQDAEPRAILDNAKGVGPQGRGQDARVNRRDARERRSNCDVEKGMDCFLNRLLIRVPAKNQGAERQEYGTHQHQRRQLRCNVDDAGAVDHHGPRRIQHMG